MSEFPGRANAGKKKRDAERKADLAHGESRVREKWACQMKRRESEALDSP